MVEASYVDHTQHWWPKGQQQTPESCCSTQDRWEIKYWMWMKPSPHCQLTAGIAFPAHRWIGGGATLTEIRGGYILAHSTDLTSLCHIEMLNYVACMRPPFWVMLELMVRVERTKTNVICLQISWSHDFPMVTWLWESGKIMGNKQCTQK